MVVACVKIDVCVYINYIYICVLVFIFYVIVQVGTNGVISFQKGTAWPRLDSSSLTLCVYCADISNSGGEFIHFIRVSLFLCPVLSSSLTSKIRLDHSRSFHKFTIIDYKINTNNLFYLTSFKPRYVTNIDKNTLHLLLFQP